MKCELERLRGLMRRPGDRRYHVTRQFVCSTYLYAKSPEEARASVEQWHPEEFDYIQGGGNIEIIEEE